MDNKCRPAILQAYAKKKTKIYRVGKKCIIEKGKVRRRRQVQPPEFHLPEQLKKNDRKRSPRRRSSAATNKSVPQEHGCHRWKLSSQQPRNRNDKHVCFPVLRQHRRRTHNSRTHDVNSRDNPVRHSRARRIHRRPLRQKKNNGHNGLLRYTASSLVCLSPRLAHIRRCNRPQHAGSNLQPSVTRYSSRLHSLREKDNSNSVTSSNLFFSNGICPARWRVVHRSVWTLRR